VADGNSVTLFSFTAPAAVGSIHVLIPGEGLLAQNGMTVTCGASTTAVAFYG
jgi:homoaconitase/3-isopropylmalate dehydratase large subunit